MDIIKIHIRSQIFFNNIKREIKFKLWSNTRRNLIDIKDVKIIFKKIISKKFVKNQEINIINPVSINTKTIVKILGRILNKEPKYVEYKFKKIQIIYIK